MTTYNVTLVKRTHKTVEAIDWQTAHAIALVTEPPDTEVEHCVLAVPRRSVSSRGGE